MQSRVSQLLTGLCAFMVCGNVWEFQNSTRFGEHTGPRLLVLASMLNRMNAARQKATLPPLMRVSL